MPKLEPRSDVVINGSIATYTFSHQSATRGTLIGNFVLKCFLLPQERLAIGREKRQMLGEFESSATEGERFTAYTLAELRHRVVSAPAFWDQGNIPETDLLYAVIDAALYAENKFAEIKQEEKEALVKKATKDAEKVIEKMNEAEKIDKELEEMDHEEEN